MIDPAAGSPATWSTFVDRIVRARLEVMPTPGASRLVDRLPRATASVCVSASPTRPLEATLDLAARLLDHGHHAVPHLAARMVESPAHVARLAAWAASHGVTDVFVIGGDARQPRGPYPDAISLARALLQAGTKLTSIGFAGYPDGHPSIRPAALDAALASKQALLEEAGISGWVSTQMCFDPSATTAWLTRLRRAGLRLPVHLGIPGAVTTTRLLATGLRLGIGASLRYLRANRSALSRLANAGRYDPTPLLAALAGACESFDVAALHVFTFNQVVATVAWQDQVAHGRSH